MRDFSTKRIQKYLEESSLGSFRSQAWEEGFISGLIRAMVISEEQFDELLEWITNRDA